MSLGDEFNIKAVIATTDSVLISLTEKQQIRACEIHLRRAWLIGFSFPSHLSN